MFKCYKFIYITQPAEVNYGLNAQPTEHSSGCQSRAMTWQPVKSSCSPYMSFLEQWNVLITNSPNFAPVQKPGQCHSPVEFTSRNWINTLGCTTNTLHHTAEGSVLSNPFITEGTTAEISDLHQDTFQCFYPWCSRMVVTLYFEYLMYLSYWLLTLFLCECWINLSIYLLLSCQRSTQGYTYM